MKNIRTLPLFAALLLVLLSGTSGAQAPPLTPHPSAQDVIDRTKHVSSTYALYQWTRIQHPGEGPFEEWAVEFNAGDLHRVETPRDRVIADCRRGTGTWYSLVTGNFEEGPVQAARICGIATNAPIRSAQWVGRVRTPFGAADRVRVTDDTLIRTYDISPEGLVLGIIYAENRPGGAVVLVTQTVRLSRDLPDPNMFDRASLAHSFVPDAYRVPPR